MAHYLEQLEEAVAATVIHSPTHFSWFGVHALRVSQTTLRALAPPMARRYLRFMLQARLYESFYCRGRATTTEANDRSSPPSHGVPAFVEALSKANTGQGYWASDWSVCSNDGDELLVERGGLKVRVNHKACLTNENGAQPGAQVRIRFPKEHFRISPGFYMALGNRELRSEGSIVRLYWNLKPEGACLFMGLVTSALNSAAISFSLKIRNDDHHFDRCDAAVLYIAKSDGAGVLRILEDVCPAIKVYLKMRTPVFVKQLAPGVGLAEDPPHNSSFGLHRCDILAEGMIQAYERGSRSLTERVEIVAACFHEHKISLETPYLNPGSTDDYHLGIAASVETRGNRAVQKKPTHDVKSVDYLQTAAEIGWLLTRTAVWHEGQCNWLGFGYGAHQPDLIRTYHALGPALYAGTSGVALFLSELCRATGDADVRRTALGAIRQALMYFEKLPVQQCLGLYTGWVGIAFAAARIGTLLGEEELIVQATKLLWSIERGQKTVNEFDLLSGKAGAIAGLIVLQRLTDRLGLLDLAVKLGDDLLQTRDKTGEGYSWKSPAIPSKHNLTGFSHGAAGVGYALLELSVVTGEQRFARAALLTHAYERRWFDTKEGNWPDFQEETKRGPKKRARTFATLWCHGAPGIALSRLRAYELLHDEQCKREAITALETTRTKIEEWLAAGTGNYSLCHGLAGDAEVLAFGFQVLGVEGEDLTACVHEVAQEGRTRYAIKNHVWPCGVYGGQTPALMVGLAGIGLFYLRLFDPSIPSMLILRPDAF